MEQTPINKNISELILNSNSVGIHIRRGNYVADAQVNHIHGTCDMDYYNRSIKYISGRITNPHFYIFSDEIEWAKQNFKIEFPMTYVDTNIGFDGENYQDDKNYEDLRLMSQCKHNIIANSSFSWWGAWLNVNPNKIIIAPKNWFADTEKNKQTISTC